jgi:hypothetical protein
MVIILYTVTSSAVNKKCMWTILIIKTTRLLRLQSRLLRAFSSPSPQYYYCYAILCLETTLSDWHDYTGPE